MNGTPARIASRIVLRSIVVLAALAAAVLNASPGHSTSFDVQWDVTIADSSTGANSDVTFQLDIAEPSANFGALVSFLPGDFTLAPDASVPNGAVAGTIFADATLGLVNGPCANPVNVEFRMMEAETDPALSIYHHDGLYDYNSDGLTENVVRSPAFMSVLFPNLQPVQRLYGQSLVAGVWVAVNFFIFEPGSPLPLLPELDPALGYPVVVILDDPTSYIIPGSITDFCSPLSTTTVLRGVSRDNPDTTAGEGGRVLHSNPEEGGTYSSVLFARSRWDGDGDGIENELDPCPYAPDPGWDPRALGNAGDADVDGLPDSCDPDDQYTNSDQDGDGFLNRQDRCPRTIEQYEAPDSDRDGVGDVCDRVPDDPSDGGLNHRHEACAVRAIEIGSGGKVPSPPACPTGPDLPVPPRFLVGAGRYVAQGAVASLWVNILQPLVYEGIPGIEVSFTISGAHNLIGKCLTDQNGQCQFNYLGANTGDDVIDVTATVSGIALSDSLMTTWVAPPPNDSFADATVVSSLPFEDEQNSVAATREVLEPVACRAGDNTYWYRFDAVSDGQLWIETPGDRSTLYLGAYEGSSLDSLELIACGEPRYYYGDPLGRADIGPACCGWPEPPSATYLTLPIESGNTYYFQAAAYIYDDPQHGIEFESITFGDANCSESMDTTDPLAILRYTAGLATDEDIECAEYADMDCNGRVDSHDALLQLRALAALEVFLHEVCASGPGGVFRGITS